MGLPAVALARGLGWVGVVTFWTILVRGDLKRLSGRQKPEAPKFDRVKAV